MSDLSTHAQAVQQALEARGFAFSVTELPDSTRTAHDAADAIGCSVSQIAKSLVFQGKESGQLILAIASGTNRVWVDKLEREVGEPVDTADPSVVRERTGFAIGGVPPVRHAESLPTFIDGNLLRHDSIWAAAGTPHAVFSLPSSALTSLTSGAVIDLKQ